MDGNTSSIDQQWAAYQIDRKEPYTAFLFICLIIGALGNGLVIVIYALKLRGDLGQRYFIPHLAVMDLIACVSASILCLLSNFYPLSFPSDSLCRFFWYTSWSSAAISTLILLLIAIQRYLSVCKPHGPQMRGKWRHLVYGSTVGTCMLLAIPFFYLTGNIPITQVYNGRNVTAYYCSTNAGEGSWRDFETVYFIGLFIIGVSNIIVTMGFYIPIGLTIYRTFNRQSILRLHNQSNEDSVAAESSVDGAQSSEVSYSTENSTKSRKSSLTHTTSMSVHNKKNIEKRTKAKNRFTLMLMLIALIYVLSNVPSLALIVVWKDDPEFWTVSDDAHFNFLIILRRLFLVNNIVNPFLYGYFDLKFRHKVAELFGLKSKTHS